jgi:hypothetical protein
MSPSGQKTEMSALPSDTGSAKRSIRATSSKFEFGFCRKGLSKIAEIQLAVRYQPVYKPAAVTIDK